MANLLPAKGTTPYAVLMFVLEPELQKLWPATAILIEYFYGRHSRLNQVEQSEQYSAERAAFRGSPLCCFCSLTHI